jgi:hypothetical protein
MLAKSRVIRPEPGEPSGFPRRELPRQDPAVHLDCERGPRDIVGAGGSNLVWPGARVSLFEANP